MDKLSNPSSCSSFCVQLLVNSYCTVSAGECNPQSVDLYYLYGLSLLENAIASNGVLGKPEEQPGEEVEEPGRQRTLLDVFCVSLRTTSLTQVTLRLNIANKTGNAADEGRFVFGADGGEDEPVDLFAQAEAMLKAKEGKAAASEKGEVENGGGEDEEEEPEDDFNAAWEILDLARKTYESMDGDINRLKLAHTYMALGDVSLETGEPCSV
jgi:HAT1-interacting factor 1